MLRYDLVTMETTQQQRERAVHEVGSRLRFPTLFGLVAGLFVVDLIIPDMIPFVDEIILGLGTLLLSRLRERPAAEEPRAEPENPPVKNVTPPSS